MTAFSPTNVRTFHANRRAHEARIQAAIEDLESQDRRNIAATAKKWGVARETLSKRFRGETVSNQEANSYARRQLTDVQEKALIGMNVVRSTLGNSMKTPRVFLQLNRIISSISFWFHVASFAVIVDW
jgi:hypothetical protein